MTPVFGVLSDRVGRRAALSAAYTLAGGYTAFAFFPMLESGETLLIYLAFIIPLSITGPLSLGVIASFIPSSSPMHGYGTAESAWAAD
jgi:MFS family permease